MKCNAPNLSDLLFTCGGSSQTFCRSRIASRVEGDVKASFLNPDCSSNTQGWSSMAESYGHEGLRQEVSEPSSWLILDIDEILKSLRASVDRAKWLDSPIILLINIC